jgi:hypothetical protein
VLDLLSPKPLTTRGRREASLVRELGPEEGEGVHDPGHEAATSRSLVAIQMFVAGNHRDPQEAAI